MKLESALYIVATPIGNMADLSARAIEVLQSVDVIAAEDTRHSARLMQNFDISTPLMAYHDHGGTAQSERILERVARGESVALISDAGTPLISDPGYRVVSMAREQGHNVVPIPGACALISALCVSGLPTDKFSFEGFLPAKATGRGKALEALKSAARTLVFYESPHRIEASLDDMRRVFGDDREVVVARELTKTFETILNGSLSSVLERVKEDANQRKGEFVVVVGGCVESQDADVIPPEALATFNTLLAELPLKQAASLASKITGEKKNRLYQWGLDNPRPK